MVLKLVSKKNTFRKNRVMLNLCLTVYNNLLEKSPRKRGIFILHKCEDVFVNVTSAFCVSIKQFDIKFKVRSHVDIFIDSVSGSQF